MSSLHLKVVQFDVSEKVLNTDNSRKLTKISSRTPLKKSQASGDNKVFELKPESNICLKKHVRTPDFAVSNHRGKRVDKKKKSLTNFFQKTSSMILGPKNNSFNPKRDGTHKRRKVKTQDKNISLYVKHSPETAFNKMKTTKVKPIENVGFGDSSSDSTTFTSNYRFPSQMLAQNGSTVNGCIAQNGMFLTSSKVNNAEENQLDGNKYDPLKERLHKESCHEVEYKIVKFPSDIKKRNVIDKKTSPLIIPTTNEQVVQYLDIKNPNAFHKSSAHSYKSNDEREEGYRHRKISSKSNFRSSVITIVRVIVFGTILITWLPAIIIINICWIFCPQCVNFKPDLITRLRRLVRFQEWAGYNSIFRHSSTLASKRTNRRSLYKGINAESLGMSTPKTYRKRFKFIDLFQSNSIIGIFRKCIHKPRGHTENVSRKYGFCKVTQNVFCNLKNKSYNKSCTDKTNNKTILITNHENSAKETDNSASNCFLNEENSKLLKKCEMNRITDEINHNSTSGNVKLHSNMCVPNCTFTDKGKLNFNSSELDCPKTECPMTKETKLTAEIIDNKCKASKLTIEERLKVKNAITMSPKTVSFTNPSQQGSCTVCKQRIVNRDKRTSSNNRDSSIVVPTKINNNVTCMCLELKKSDQFQIQSPCNNIKHPKRVISICECPTPIIKICACPNISCVDNNCQTFKSDTCMICKNQISKYTCTGDVHLHMSCTCNADPSNVKKSDHRCLANNSKNRLRPRHSCRGCLDKGFPLECKAKESRSLKNNCPSIHGGGSGFGLFNLKDCIKVHSKNKTCIDNHIEIKNCVDIKQKCKDKKRKKKTNC